MSRPFVIVGDEAYTESEWAELQRVRERDRIRYRNPARRAAVLERARKWAAEHPHRRREVSRLHERRKRLLRPRLVGTLHGLACTGPTRDTGCRCSKIRCYDKPR